METRKEKKEVNDRCLKCQCL